MLGQLGGKVKFCPTFGVMDQIFGVVEQILFLTLKFQLTSLEELDARAIRIPYVGGRVVMDIILPNQK